MKESAPKRQKKKSAGEIGEAEYTPIRRRRTKNPGSVMLSEDEISVAYNRPQTQSCEQEEITAAADSFENEAVELTQATDSIPDGVQEISEETIETFAEVSEAQAPTSEDDSEEMHSESTDESLETEASDEPIPEEATVEEDANPVSESPLPRAPQFERVVLPEEISLVGVLPLEEESDSEEEVQGEAQEAEAEQNEPVSSQEEEDIIEDEEEFVFTPMPTPVVYERVVLPDEISLVDLFPEFNIPIVQPEEPSEQTTEADGDSESCDSRNDLSQSDDSQSDGSQSDVPQIEEDTASDGEQASETAEQSPAQCDDSTVESGAQAPVTEENTDAEASESTEQTPDGAVDETCDEAEAAMEAADEAPSETVDEAADENGESVVEARTEEVDDAEKPIETVVEEENDPFAAEFDFSQIDFDTLTRVEPSQIEESDETDETESDAASFATNNEDADETAEQQSEASAPSEIENVDETADAEHDIRQASSADEQTAPATEDGEVQTDMPSEEVEQQSSEQSEHPAEQETSQFFPDAPKKKKEKKPAQEPRPIENRFDIVELFAFTLALVFIITAFFFRSSTVNGSSMANTLHHGDQLILYSFLYEPEVNDIIVFEDYTTPYKEPLVKRVIATEGQTVTILDPYTVLVDGVALKQDYVFVDYFDDTHYPIRYTVSEGHLFVMGDHRNASSDSRVFGEVAKSSVLGKVILRYYPFEDFTYFND